MKEIKLIWSKKLDHVHVHAKTNQKVTLKQKNKTKHATSISNIRKLQTKQEYLEHHQRNRVVRSEDNLNS